MSTESATAAPSPAAPARPPASVGADESWTSFAAWAADELRLRVVAADGRYRLEHEPTEPADKAAEPARSWIRRRRRDADQDAAAPASFEAETAHDAVAELIARLHEGATPAHARPADQPTAVHDLTDRLFDAYTLDGGKAHLAGFHLEDRPFVRLTQLLDGGADTPRVRHWYFDPFGEPVAPALVAALGLDRVVACEDAPRADPGRLAQAIDAARGRLDADASRLAASIVWAKHAEGRLRFEFGDKSVDAAFAGWARTLAAPAVACPQTGRPTRHLATTDDGRIAAADAIAVCAVTGRRWLRDELGHCAVSGKLVEPDQLTRCEATDEPVLPRHVVRCARCGLAVAENAVTPTGCRGCDAAERVGPDDPRLAAIVAARPELAQPRWTLAETPRAYVLETSGWLRRRCVTIDKESLAVAHEAACSRFSSTWRRVS